MKLFFIFNSKSFQQVLNYKPQRKVKKLEDLFDVNSSSIEKNEMFSLIGGKEKPTQLLDGATLKNYGGGCSQADVNKNDKQTLVGDVICTKDTTVVMFSGDTLIDTNDITNHSNSADLVW